MKTIYMESTLVFMQKSGVNIEPIIKSGTIKTTKDGVNYVLIKS